MISQADEPADSATVAKVDPAVAKNIRLNLWNAVSEIADLDLQTAVWGKVDNAHCTYSEFIECYFDCMVYDVDTAIDANLISAPEGNAIRALHEALDSYETPTGDPYDEKAILSDPKWRAITVTAEAARQALLDLVNCDEADALKKAGADVANYGGEG